MARRTGPRMKLVRRLGMPLELKLREDERKADIERPPGGKRRPRLTPFGERIREAQRVKVYYGILDRQFRRYFQEAVRRPGDTGVVLLELLERRLDNVVCRLGFAATRAQARQAIVHGHLRVNGRKVSAPSYAVRAGDAIEPHPRERSQALVQAARELTKDRPVPSWLTSDTPGKGRVVSLPGRNDVPAAFEMRYVVEYLARRTRLRRRARRGA